MLKVQVNERSTKFSALINTDAFWNLRRSTCVFSKLIWVTWVLMSVLCITYMWVHSARFQVSATKSLITVNNLHIGNTSTCADPHTRTRTLNMQNFLSNMYIFIYVYSYFWLWFFSPLALTTNKNRHLEIILPRYIENKTTANTEHLYGWRSYSHIHIKLVLARERFRGNCWQYLL
jgi:hypothetical protein